MTLPIERARTRRPVTWLTIIGVILLPVLIGGILVAALYNPTERLDAMTAAVVNLDEPVTIDDQYTPLGRQLTAGLVEGSDEVASNLTWVLSNETDAAEGLADGTYQAVVTIPDNFSAAATSSGQAMQGTGSPEQATIRVTTPPDSLIVDDAITTQITQTAASVMGSMLSSLTLENVFLGFTTLGDQLGEAAGGAAQLADGAAQSADGAAQLASGADDLAGGVGQLASGADGIASGAAGLADGAGQLAGGLQATSDGLDEWAAGATDTAAGTRGLATGLVSMADAVAQLPAVPQQVVDAANAIAANSGTITQNATDAAAQLADLAATCAEQGGSAQLCEGLAAASARANDALPVVTDVLAQSGTIAAGVGQLAQFGPQLTAGLQQSAAGASALADGMDRLASGATASAAGVDQLATGASGLAGGATQLAGGAAQLADGAHAAASGAVQWSDGASALSAGIAQLAAGTGTLADGLEQASGALPSYTDAEAQSLAAVVSDPVAAEGGGGSLFGAAAVPLLAALALWLGGLASYVALQSVTRRALTSRRPSALLALRGFAPGAAIGAVQGLLVAGVVQFAAGYAWADWFAFAGIAVLAGVAFAAVNQALVAAFGGLGRWIAALVAAIAVATGIVSTVPGWLTGIAALLPTTPAYEAMLGVLNDAGGVAAGIMGLVVWALLAFGVTVVAVARKRTASARDVLRPASAPA